MAVPLLIVASEDLRATYATIIAAVAGGDDAAFDCLLVKDFVDHNPVPGQPPGRAGFAYWAASARTAFADLHGTNERCHPFVWTKTADELLDHCRPGQRTSFMRHWRSRRTQETRLAPMTGTPPRGRRVSARPMP